MPAVIIVAKIFIIVDKTVRPMAPIAIPDTIILDLRVSLLRGTNTPEQQSVLYPA